MANKKKEKKIACKPAELKWLMLMVKFVEMADKTCETMERLEKEGKGNDLMYQMCNATMEAIEYAVNVMHALEHMEMDGGLTIHYADKDGEKTSEEVVKKGTGKA